MPITVIEPGGFAEILADKNLLLTSHHLQPLASMIQSNLFQNEQQNGWIVTGPGVQRQVLGYDDKLMLVKVKFEKGGVGEAHSHPHAQASYVESGSFEMTIGDAKKIINKGDGYYVPPYTVHSCICLEEGMLVDSFSPCRWDFVQTDTEKYTL